MKTFFPLAAATIFLTTVAASANANLILDGDFSGSNVTPGNFSYSSGIIEPNWMFSPKSGIANHDYRWGSAANQGTVAFLQIGTDYRYPVVSQQFTSPSSNFILSFGVASRDYSGGSEQLNVYIDNNEVIANLPAGNGSLNSYTFNVSGLVGNSHTLKFDGVNPGLAYDSALLITNVSVIAVPEPETYAMLLAGLGVLGFVARRRKSL